MGLGAAHRGAGRGCGRRDHDRTEERTGDREQGDEGEATAQHGNSFRGDETPWSVGRAVMSGAEPLRASGATEERLIPHHSIAIHTCLNASITDREIEDLCDEIITSQRSEIAQMKAIRERIDD